MSKKEYKLNKDGYYRTSVTVKERSGNSRRIFLRAKGPDELDRLVIETQLLIERGEICFNSSTPFERYAQEWLEVYKKDSTAPKNYKTYEANLRLHICPVIGKIPLRDIRATHCKKVLNAHSGESKSHVSKLRMTMYQIFEQAIEDEYILKNPARKLTLPNVTEGTHRPITDFERQHILKVAESHRGGLWVLTMLYCGLRPCETISLFKSDIDLKKNVIKIRKSKTDAGIRTVPMPAFLADRFSEYLKGTKTTFVFHQAKDESKPHTEESMRCMWENFKREVDISMGAQVKRNQIILSVVADDLTPYCLRHTCATDYQTAGVPINIAKVLLGHEDISTTGNIYTAYTEEHAAQTAEKLSGFWYPKDKKSAQTT